MPRKNIKRTIRSGYLNFKRSGFPTIASVGIMVVTLFIVTFFIYIQVILNTTLNNIKDRVDVTIYFVPRAEETAILNVEQELKKLPEVKTVSYTSENEALTQFKEKHSGDYLTLQALDELSSNPLGASLNIKAKDPSQYENIANYFEGDNAVAKDSLTIIDKIDYNQNKVVIDRLSSIIKGAQKLGLILSLIFIIISIFITFNTIRLIIFMSREDITTMKLVGANKKYIRGPFVVSGIIIGVIASVITIILFLPISYWFGVKMTSFLGVNFFEYYKASFFQLFFIQLISGIIIGGISSFLATYRYLRK